MSTIDSIVSGGVGTFGSTPFTVIGSPTGGDSGTGLWTVLAQLVLDSGLEYLAIRDIDLLGRTYDGRVQKWGRVDKSIAILSGMPQTGDATFRIADPDYRWRDLAAAQPLRGRTIRLKFVKADVTADDFLPFFTGEIVKASSGPSYLEITARDMSWAWMDEAIPPLLTADNFPYITPDSDGSFAKIIIGSVNHETIGGLIVGSDQYGAISLIHMGLVGSVDRYSVARHSIFDIAVYRKTSAGGDAYFPVDPGEYNVVVETLNVDNYIYEMTFVDFLVAQEAGASIRANVDGLHFRPAFGEYAAEGFDPDLNPTGTPGVLTNPIDGLLNVFRLECRKATLFDHDGIMAIRSKFASMTFVAGGSGSYESAGVMEEQETPRTFFGKYLPCFDLDMFHNRAGEIALSFPDAEPVERPFFSDNRHDGRRQLIGKESFYEEDPSPVANRCVLPAYRHYAANKWLWTGVYDNFNDQAALSVIRRNDDDSIVYDDGVAVRDARIEPITSESWFCRDFQTIYDVAVRRMSFASLGSYQQVFDLPTPEVIEDIELAKRILVTHRAGRAVGGYSQEELKIVGMSYDLAGFRTTLTTVRGIPGTILVNGIVVVGTVTMAADSELTAVDSTTEGFSFLASTSAASLDIHSATTPAIDTTGAEFLVAAVGDYIFSGESAVTDNYGNTWHRSPPTKYAETDDFGDLAAVQIWFCIPAAVGPLHTFSATNIFPEFPSQPSIAVAAYRGIPNASPFDVENGAFGALIDSLQPGSITPSEDRELVITALALDTARASILIDEGFTVVEIQQQTPNAYGVALAYLIQTSAAAVNPLWDTTPVFGGCLTASIASFKSI